MRKRKLFGPVVIVIGLLLITVAKCASAQTPTPNGATTAQDTTPYTAMMVGLSLPDDCELWLEIDPLVLVGPDFPLAEIDCGSVTLPATFFLSGTFDLKVSRVMNMRGLMAQYSRFENGTLVLYIFGLEPNCNMDMTVAKQVAEDFYLITEMHEVEVSTPFTVAAERLRELQAEGHPLGLIELPELKVNLLTEEQILNSIEDPFIGNALPSEGCPVFWSLVDLFGDRDSISVGLTPQLRGISEEGICLFLQKYQDIRPIMIWVEVEKYTFTLALTGEAECSYSYWGANESAPEYFTEEEIVKFFEWLVSNPGQLFGRD